MAKFKDGDTQSRTKFIDYKYALKVLRPSLVVFY